MKWIKFKTLLMLRKAFTSNKVTALKNRINDLAMKATSARSHLKLAKDTPSFTTVLRWRKADNFQACKESGNLSGHFIGYTRTS